NSLHLKCATSLHRRCAMSDHFGSSTRLSGEVFTRGAMLSNPSPLSKVRSSVATGSSFVCRTTPRCTRWVMSCHTPWRLTRTRTALRRGGIYESALGDFKRISDTTAPPSRLRVRWLRPRHVVWRAGLLRHVAQGLPVGLPLFACRAHRNWSVREYDPVCLRKPAISLHAKRGPRLGLSFFLDLLFGAPCPCNVGHYSITSGSGNRSDSGASGPWNLSNVTSS